MSYSKLSTLNLGYLTMNWIKTIMSINYQSSSVKVTLFYRLYDKKSGIKFIS